MNRKFGVHPDVLKLGLVSFLTDVSSEMIFSVFAIFFTTIAGASSALLGLVEGFADFSASSLDYVAGWLSDKTGKRKVFALAGYGFSTIAKVILLVANSVAALSFFRIIERLGKSFRGPPRDAWLSAIAAKDIRGYSFGVHKAFDKAGAILGPLVAYGLLSWLGDTASTFRILFWVAFVPAVISIFVLGLIKDQPQVQRQREGIFVAWKTLSSGFKRYLVAAGIFSLAYFSFGFLLLRAFDVGFSVRNIVLLYALFNVSFVAAAPLAGKLGDRIGREYIVVLSYLIYLVMSLGFALATTKMQIILLFLVYGVFYSMDEAQSKAFIADLEPQRRATAIGLFNFVTGMIYLPASLIAGALWAAHANLVFVLAAFLSLAAISTFVFLRPAQQGKT
ncbi:MAG TPA: MFS transporter [Candidatus Dormibacteraeota bacterium]|nr:MFS transporter [Candidatus Dormibacteraeota bacterium]